MRGWFPSAAGGERRTRAALRHSSPEFRAFIERSREERRDLKRPTGSRPLGRSERSGGLASSCSEEGGAILIGESTVSMTPPGSGVPSLASLTQQLKALQRQHLLLQQQLCNEGSMPACASVYASAEEEGEEEREQLQLQQEEQEEEGEEGEVDEQLPTAEALSEAPSLGLLCDPRFEGFESRISEDASPLQLETPSWLSPRSQIDHLNHQLNNQLDRLSRISQQNQLLMQTQQSSETAASPHSPLAVGSRAFLFPHATGSAIGGISSEATRASPSRSAGPPHLSLLLTACRFNAASSSPRKAEVLASPVEALDSRSSSRPLFAKPAFSASGAALRQKRAGNSAFSDVLNSVPEVRQRIAGLAKKASLSISETHSPEEVLPLTCAASLCHLGKTSELKISGISNGLTSLCAIKSANGGASGGAGGGGCVIKSVMDANSPPIARLAWNGGDSSSGNAGKGPREERSPPDGDSQGNAGFADGSSNSNNSKLPPSGSDSSTCPPPAASSATSAGEVVKSHLILYRGPEELPNCMYRRLFDPKGPVQFASSPLLGAMHPRGELRLWPRVSDRIISQNSSKRKVHRACWLSPIAPDVAFPVAVKFVEDGNLRDGRSIKREIECHLYIYQRLGALQRHQLSEEGRMPSLGDVWPCAELLGYFLNRKEPGQSVLITRKLSGPDFFDVIRAEHSSAFNAGSSSAYAQHKLHWCVLALERVAQYALLGIRHNDIKPDNIVLDFYASPNSNERLLDVKLIDLGTACMQGAKDFTGGTSWYESPEQKVLEFHTKKHRNPEVAKQVDIGLPSDAWGAGVSITEVLMGRRVVDVLRAPHGPGPLEFRGVEDGWVIEPEVWVSKAREALGMDAPQQRFPVCAAAARLIFGLLVKAKPDERATVQEALVQLKRFIREASSDPNSAFYEEFHACRTAQEHQTLFERQAHQHRVVTSGEGHGAQAASAHS